MAHVGVGGADITISKHAGKTLYVPKIDVSQPGKMDFFKVYGNDDLKSLPRGAWDIREPDREWQGQPRLNGAHTLPCGGGVFVLMGF